MRIQGAALPWQAREPKSPLWVCFHCGQQNGEMRERCRGCNWTQDRRVVAVYTSAMIEDMRKFAAEMFSLEAPTIMIDSLGIHAGELGFEVNLTALAEFSKCGRV